MIYDKRTDKWNLKTDIYSQKELEEDRKRILKGVRAQNIQAQIEYERTHKHGYCPICHCLIPTCGRCDCQD